MLNNNLLVKKTFLKSNFGVAMHQIFNEKKILSQIFGKLSCLETPQLCSIFHIELKKELKKYFLLSQSRRFKNKFSRKKKKKSRKARYEYLVKNLNVQPNAKY